MTDLIRSKRLDLIPLVPEFLQAMLAHDLARAERSLGYSLPEGLLDSTDVMELRLKQLRDDPALQPWLLRAIVLRDQRVMVGHIGFHTGPGADYLQAIAPGAVEFGFTVYPPHQRQGYAREASVAVMRWAKETHGVTRFVLSIRPDNVPSQALAASFGFIRIGSHVDEVDGVEDILQYMMAGG